MNVKNKVIFRNTFPNRVSVDDEINSLKNSEQIWRDCYLISTLEALTNCKNGRELLKKNIKPVSFSDNMTKPVCMVKFGDIGTIPVYADEYARVNNNDKKQENFLVKNVEVAFSKLIKKDSKAKPWICKIASIFCKHNFEYNIPSNFMKIFTGKKPISIGEKNLNINLKPYEKETKALFKRMEENSNYSFIVGTGVKKFDRYWHCYTVEKVENGEIYLKNKRGNEIKKYTYDEAIKTLKYIVGYFDEDLK